MDDVRGKIEKMNAYGKQMAAREVWNGPQTTVRNLGLAYCSFKRAKDLRLTPGM